MDNIDLMNYWLKSSDDDFETMQVMFQNKRNTWSLFLGHLVIEKLLKGLYAKSNVDSPHAIKSNNLLALAEKCNLELTDKQIERLQTITQFNISARYDDYKENFKQKCTEEYTTKQINNIKEIRTMVKRTIDSAIMESIRKYIEKISKHYKSEANIIWFLCKRD